MTGPRTLRLGELTAESLLNALGAERAAGRRPSVVVVGSMKLFARAVQVLKPPAGGLSDLMASIPSVEFDEALPEDGWELRETSQLVENFVVKALRLA